MSKGQHTFKQGDLTKALKGAENAGMKVKQVKIETAPEILSCSLARKPARPKTNGLPLNEASQVHTRFYRP
jgi:hypothetical protein